MDSKQDQELAKMRDGLPGVWWALYVGCIQKGFDTKQSMSILHAFIMAQNPYGIRPDNPMTEPPDTDS